MFLQSQNLIINRAGSPPLSFPDLSINVKDSVLLLGPSGSGKTTLLSALAGFLKPTGGKVLVEEKDFYSMSSVKRDAVRGKNFGFVFQTLHLLPSLTLGQNIALAADMSGAELDQRRLDNLLQTLGLADKTHRRPDALSQGEQQRAAIARAILLKPKIIIADEPTSALDDYNAQAVIELLQKQALDTGAALLIATHDSRIKSRFKNIISLENQMKEAA